MSDLESAVQAKADMHHERQPWDLFADNTIGPLPAKYWLSRSSQCPRDTKHGVHKSGRLRGRSPFDQ